MKTHTLIGNRIEDVSKEINEINLWGSTVEDKVNEIKGRKFESQEDVNKANSDLQELLAEVKYKEELHKKLFETRKGFASLILRSTNDSAAKLITASHFLICSSINFLFVMLPLMNSYFFEFFISERFL